MKEPFVRHELLRPGKKSLVISHQNLLSASLSNERKYELSPGRGSGYISNFSVDYRFDLIRYAFKLNKPAKILGTSKGPMYILSVSFSSGVTWETTDGQHEHCMHSMEYYLYHIHDMGAISEYDPDTLFSGLTIVMHPNEIEHFGILPLSEGQSFAVSVGRMSKLATKIAYDLMSPKVEGISKGIYLQGKILELLAVIIELEFERTRRECKGEENSLNSRIYEARLLIDAQIQSPMTIESLCRQVCLNETYLTRGFKSIFGMTIHKYVLSERMRIAMTLLSETQKTVDEIALLVGYQSANSFIKAFKKALGFTPTKMRNRSNKYAFG